MLYRKRTRRMSNERFERWFTAFKTPYKQKKFIYSYRSLENPYTELVIRHLLTARQKAKVKQFIHALPKMSPRRFQRFLQKLYEDHNIIYRYSYKDFTKRQHAVIHFYLLRSYIKQSLF